MTATCGPGRFPADLRVMLHNPDAFACAVLIYFAPPRVPAPNVKPRVQDYKLCGVLSHLPAGDWDATAFFRSRFAVSGAGCELWARFIPLSPLGFRGQPVGVDCVVESN